MNLKLDDKDIKGKIYPRLVSLTMTESPEDAVDQLDITQLEM